MAWLRRLFRGDRGERQSSERDAIVSASGGTAANVIAHGASTPPWVGDAVRDGAVPAVPMADIMAWCADLERALEVTLGPEPYRAFLPTLRAFQEYVHLLPASEYHHHAYPGGLVRHGMECAVSAVQLADGMIFAAHEEPRERRVLQDCWRVAAAVAGILHDLGKLLTDVSAVAQDGQRWLPWCEGLGAWIGRVGVERYRVCWVPDRRHRWHDGFNLVLFSHVVHPTTLSYLAPKGRHDVLLGLAEAIGRYAGSENPLPKILREADEASVEIDLKRSREHRAACGIGAQNALAHRIVRFWSEQIRGQKWRLDQGPAWYYQDGGMAFSFPAALEYAREALAGQGGSQSGDIGIPSDPLVLAEMLADYGYVMVHLDNAGNMTPIWHGVLENEGRRVSMRFLRVPDARLYLGDLPLPIAVRITWGEPVTLKQDTMNAEAERNAESAEGDRETGSALSKGKRLQDRSLSPSNPGEDEDIEGLLAGLPSLACEYLEDIAEKIKKNPSLAWSDDDGVLLAYPDIAQGMGTDPERVCAILNGAGCVVGEKPVMVSHQNEGQERRRAALRLTERGVALIKAIARRTATSSQAHPASRSVKRQGPVVRPGRAPLRGSPTKEADPNLASTIRKAFWSLWSSSKIKGMGAFERSEMIRLLLDQLQVAHPEWKSKTIEAALIDPKQPVLRLVKGSSLLTKDSEIEVCDYNPAADESTEPQDGAGSSMP